MPCWRWWTSWMTSIPALTPSLTPTTCTRWCSTPPLSSSSTPSPSSSGWNHWRCLHGCQWSSSAKWHPTCWRNCLLGFAGKSPHTEKDKYTEKDKDKNCCVFCICLLTYRYQKYKSVELGNQLRSYQTLSDHSYYGPSKIIADRFNRFNQFRSINIISDHLNKSIPNHLIPFPFRFHNLTSTQATIWSTSTIFDLSAQYFGPSQPSVSPIFQVLENVKQFHIRHRPGDSLLLRIGLLIKIFTFITPKNWSAVEIFTFITDTLLLQKYLNS